MRDINEAVEEARKFIECADNLKLAIKESAYTNTTTGYTYHSSCPKESGALRRQSMTLTRALANMRKP